MHSTPSDETRNGDQFQQAESVTDDESNRADQPRAIGSIIVCDVDLPLFLSGGVVYLQAPLQDVVDAFTTSLSEGLRDLESRISEARSAALSFDALQRELPGFGLAFRIVVPGSGE